MSGRSTATRWLRFATRKSVLSFSSSICWPAPAPWRTSSCRCSTPTTPPRERRERALEALREVGIADRSEHHPAQLSGGQQQRVAIARALVNRPRLILADEPTGALDSRSGVEIMAIFQRLNREAGITLVVVTHEPDIAAYANRVLRFKDGRLVSDERVAEPVHAQAALERWIESEEQVAV